MTEHYKALVEGQRKLIQIHQLKLERQRRLASEVRQKKGELEKAVEKRRAEITQLESSLSDIQNEIVLAEGQRSFVKNRGYWLNYDLEREEFYLPMELEDLETANAELKAAIKEVEKEEGILKFIRQNHLSCQKKLDQFKEIQLEAEVYETSYGKVKY